MTDVLNPYAPPTASLEPMNSDGYWSDGNILVLRPGSKLPSRCVKCNAPAEGPAKPRKVYWHHPAIYLLVLLNLLIYAIVALIVRKSALVHPGLCALHRKRRMGAIGLGWGGFFMGLCLAVAGFANDSVALGLLGILLLLGSLVASLILARIVYPERIDKDFIRLRGCGKAFLESLPPFHG